MHKGWRPEQSRIESLNYFVARNEVVQPSKTNYADAVRYPPRKKPVPVPEPQETDYESDDEILLKRFEHNDTQYLRDEDTYAIYHPDTKIKLGIYNEGADEVDLYEPTEY